ncbi:MAG TPA: FAD-linked oxidase C-terminal domain-containing protein [Anaerolineales bacterium]|nr:FAD-linked oxidase C-terminal domain-containing protein [Anaerolineales bacterium]
MPLHPDTMNELRKRFTGEIREDLATRLLYSTDASIYQIEPRAVAIPKTHEDLQAAVEFAAKYKIPILPRGAGTSLAGQAIGDALVLDCSRWLDQIVEIDPEEHHALVEPGVVLSKLNQAAARHGLQYGPDPASADRATMGGVIANNATGAHSILYGMSADHLLSADVILSDGSLETWDDTGRSTLSKAAFELRERYADAITENFPKTWRNSAGYRLNYLLPWSPSRPTQWMGESYPANLRPGTLNLAPLLAGSEGTLAVIRQARVNLVPKPKHTIIAVLSYESIPDACDEVPRLLAHHPSAVELIPRFIIRQARSVPAYARQMGWVLGDPAALLVVEFSGDEPSVLREKARDLGEILTRAESQSDQARVWNVRRVGLGLLDSRPQSARPVAFIEDCAIPVNRLGEFVREVERILSAHGTEGGIYAHASAGCLHIRPILDLKTKRGVRDLREISEAILSLTLSLGGAMSSEHGDGLARSEFLERTYGPELMEAMRMLKRGADPHNLLNPGKIIDAGKMDVNLRYGVDYQVQAWNSNLSFASRGGLAVAIEQCNGQGLCRKNTGVMCPSFQATREEMHSTRGRANLLRALISSPEIIANRQSEIENGVAQALDLCLACKGCTAECPSGVDMPRLKFAFQEEYYKTHRRQFRDYVFGYFHIAAGLGSSLAPISNAVMKVPAIKNLVARTFGITPHRPFPVFKRAQTRVSRTPAPSRDLLGKSCGVANPPNRKIIFLSDPFARYIEPETEQAALDILSGSGFDVHVLPILGAGASLLSKGFIDAARRHGMRVLDALRQADPAGGAPVVGIEPPEIYTLKHDYADLLPERAAEVHQRISRAWLLDEFLVRSAEFENLRVAKLGQASRMEPTLSKRIKFHPHCHQRVEGLAADGLPIGTTATVDLLRACGYDIELLEAGCCGMAGAFGYEAEHYALSMKIGELKLFPALRTPTALSGTSPKSDMESSHVSQPSAIGFGGGWEGVVSTGAACRMQIQQGVGIKAEHSIVMVARALFGPEFS